MHGCTWYAPIVIAWPHTAPHLTPPHPSHPTLLIRVKGGSLPPPDIQPHPLTDISNPNSTRHILTQPPPPTTDTSNPNHRQTHPTASTNKHIQTQPPPDTSNSIQQPTHPTRTTTRQILNQPQPPPPGVHGSAVACSVARGNADLPPRRLCDPRGPYFPRHLDQWGRKCRGESRELFFLRHDVCVTL